MLLMSTGKEFQRVGAATEKEQAPNDCLMIRLLSYIYAQGNNLIPLSKTYFHAR